MKVLLILAASLVLQAPMANAEIDLNQRRSALIFYALAKTDACNLLSGLPAHAKIAAEAERQAICHENFLEMDMTSTDVVKAAHTTVDAIGRVSEAINSPQYVGSIEQKLGQFCVTIFKEAGNFNLSAVPKSK